MKHKQTSTSKMNSIKVKEMIKFSLFKNIQNKWFLIFNIFTLVSILLLLNWNFLSAIFATPSAEKPKTEIAVLDSAHLAFEQLHTHFSSEKDWNVFEINENTYTAENIPDNLILVEIIPDQTEAFTTSITSKEGISTDIYTPLTEQLLAIRNQHLATQYGLEAENLQVLQSELHVNRIMLAVDSDHSDTKELIKLISSTLTYLLTVLIFSKLANEIAQEKQSKSSEYILTTVSAKEYLFAKIFSNIAILLLQGIFLFIYYFIAIALHNLITIVTTDISLSTSTLTADLSSVISVDMVTYILALLGYNLLNLILLCIIQATLSAKTASTTEASNTVSLLVTAMMIGYVVVAYFITPYTKVGPILTILSCLPILSAYFVPAIMVIGQATALQVVISLLLLVLAIPITFRFCSIHFKNGILDYSKKNVKKIKPVETAKQFLQKREMKHIGFVIGMAILIYFGLQTVFSLILSFALPAYFSHIGETDLLLINQIVVQVLSLGLATCFVFAYTSPKTAPKKAITRKNQVGIILTAFFLIFVLQFFITFVVYPKLGLDYDVTEMLEISSNSTLFTKLLTIIGIALIPAIFEELFFRKAIIDFTSKYGTTFALLFSAILFGFIHLNLSQGLFAFIIGILFGSIYLYSRDIKLTILLHFMNNGYAALAEIAPPSAEILLFLLLVLLMIAGFGYLIYYLVKADYRQKIKNFFKRKCDLQQIKVKYKYLFTDFSFCVSIVLLSFLFLLTENMLQ